MPGFFLQRSTLGFTDHHVAEVFFSTLALAAFLWALRTAEGDPLGRRGSTRPLSAGLRWGCTSSAGWVYPSSRS